MQITVDICLFNRYRMTPGYLSPIHEMVLQCVPSGFVMLQCLSPGLQGSLHMDYTVAIAASKQKYHWSRELVRMMSHALIHI